MEHSQFDFNSYDLYQISKDLVATIREIADTAQGPQMTPPFELHVTDADDEVVVHAAVDVDEQGQIKLRNLAPEGAIKAQAPLVVTLTDINGNGFEGTITHASRQ